MGSPTWKPKTDPSRPSLKQKTVQVNPPYSFFFGSANATSIPVKATQQSPAEAPATKALATQTPADTCSRAAAVSVLPKEKAEPKEDVPPASPVRKRADAMAMPARATEQNKAEVNRSNPTKSEKKIPKTVKPAGPSAAAKTIKTRDSERKPGKKLLSRSDAVADMMEELKRLKQTVNDVKDDQKDTDDELRKLNGRLKETEQELKKTKQKHKGTKEKLDRTEQDLEKTKEKLEQTERDLEETKQEQKDMEGKVERLGKEVEKLRAVLEGRSPLTESMPREPAKEETEAEMKAEAEKKTERMETKRKRDAENEGSAQPRKKVTTEAAKKDLEYGDAESSLERGLS
ncbi:hypothetical protein H2203_004466 [Taxawa tesnikishii (nom. ined.)]|nr:hypothetical protein H2203_004466 [Dothideales sp. JES 119]